MKRKWAIIAAVLTVVVFFIVKGAKLAFAVKEGALLPTPLKATTARILDVVSEVWKANGYVATVTSGVDGTHMAQSKHYSGDAIDFRTRDVDPVKLRAMTTTVRSRLGVDYDVIPETDHLHVEYDPK